jgi:hypothetical protein
MALLLPSEAVSCVFFYKILFVSNLIVELCLLRKKTGFGKGDFGLNNL